MTSLTAFDLDTVLRDIEFSDRILDKVIGLNDPFLRED